MNLLAKLSSSAILTYWNWVQPNKEQSCSLLILFATNFVPLDWTVGRDNFAFECETMHAIQKEEKVPKLSNRNRPTVTGPTVY